MKFKFLLQIIIFLASVFYFSTAQCEKNQTKSFKYYDSITYQYYLAGSWNDLIWNGNQALSSGYDYKNLRLRIGFAYFFKKNYRFAADHFYKALQFDSYDSVAAIYFNLSCQASGRSDEVYQVKGCKKPHRLLDYVYADAGFMAPGRVNNSASISDSITVFKELIQPVSRSYASLGLNFRPHSRLSIFLGYSDMRITDRKTFGYLSQHAERDTIIELEYERDYFYTFPNVKNLAEQEFNNQQSALYLNLTYYPVSGLKITPAFHYLHINSNSIIASPVATTKSDTAWYNKFDNTWHMFEYTAYDYEIKSYDSSYSDYIISIGVSKEHGNCSLGINGTYAELLNKKLYQFGASLTWYPFGNTNLYTNSRITYLFDQKKTTTVFEQMAGGKIYENGWLEGFFTWGEIKNYNEKNAYIVYNQVYPVKMRCGVTLYPYLGEHFELMLIYRFQRIGLLLTSATYTDSQPVVSNPDLKFSTFVGGVKWKF